MKTPDNQQCEPPLQDCLTDQQRFARACEALAGSDRSGGIGTLGEKTLHAALKLYLEPDCSKHEVKLGRYVADIVNEHGIIEIQTQNFNTLRKKLTLFLESGAVTVVYPVAQTKWLCWIDSETGEVTKKRKSPRNGAACDVLYELYKIKPLLRHPNLRICTVLLQWTEYRNLNGWSRDKKRGSSRCERIPDALTGAIYLHTAADYAGLVPQTLEGPFTAKDYAKATKRSLRFAQTAVHVLCHVGALQRTGKVRNSYLYEKAGHNDMEAQGGGADGAAGNLP